MKWNEIENLGVKCQTIQLRKYRTGSFEHSLSIKWTEFISEKIFREHPWANSSMKNIMGLCLSISLFLYLLQLFDLSYHSFVLALIYESIPRYVYIMAHSIHTTLWQKISFSPWSRRLLCPGFFFGYTPRTTMEVRQVKVSAAYHIRCLQAWHRKTICLLYYVLLTSTYYIVVTYNNLTPMMHETSLLLMAQHKVPSNKLSYPSFFQTLVANTSC